MIAKAEDRVSQVDSLPGTRDTLYMSHTRASLPDPTCIVASLSSSERVERLALAETLLVEARRAALPLTAATHLPDFHISSEHLSEHSDVVDLLVEAGSSPVDAVFLVARLLS